ncbi:hypothetical protein FOZ61_007638 [Perkinsus olseni]|uniref:cAMP-dependent protein kinase catalytic subunit n=2 Tax=Perkinsus olseni TaxID=32597 RepID=A0A7J6L821_PEROL|nr:hypothetical protein FOZ61_007638 [Perkinsus olseni]
MIGGASLAFYFHVNRYDYDRHLQHESIPVLREEWRRRNMNCYNKYTADPSNELLEEIQRNLDITVQRCKRQLKTDSREQDVKDCHAAIEQVVWGVGVGLLGARMREGKIVTYSQCMEAADLAEDPMNRSQVKQYPIHKVLIVTWSGFHVGNFRLNLVTMILIPGRKVQGRASFRLFAALPEIDIFGWHVLWTREEGNDTDAVSNDCRADEAHSVKRREYIDRVARQRALVSRKPRYRLEDFDLRATVGTGTFGRVRVVKIKGCKDRTPFALKILKKSEVIRLKQIEHVKAEREILEKLSHPFIVNLFTTFRDDKRLFMLMEYVNGGELFSHLRKEGRLPNEEARFYAAEIVLAFQYMHSLDVVYRDLKPENLLIDFEGHIKITDFGFAKVVTDRTWTLCGTPEYLAPEIIQSKGHGKAVDWWALGILIFEMLAGYPPFYDDNPFGIYQKILLGRIDFPKHFDSKAKDLVRHLLARDRVKRYGCLRDGVEDIKRHKWFKGIDWDAAFDRELPAPFIPQVRGPDDTSMFDRYPESTENSSPSIIGAEYEDAFRDF